jgi:hypothetical protein
MTTALRTLLPPGGFSNLVGHHVAALDVGLETLKDSARALPGEVLHTVRVAGLPTPDAALRAAAQRECAWVHATLGNVTSPAEPAPRAPLDAVLAWLDAVRTVSLMVLRPLQDRDLERLLALPGVPGRTTLRRMLTDLLEHQAERRAEVRLAQDRLA